MVPGLSMPALLGTLLHISQKCVLVLDLWQNPRGLLWFSKGQPPHGVLATILPALSSDRNVAVASPQTVPAPLG